mmetsp:Transcript_19612/g.52915  ORF Transcript_19612/g.52915 Transcript_19612/m.52915 type:complete len:373 (-) Transcript_19612:882-2000(-)
MAARRGERELRRERVPGLYSGDTALVLLSAPGPLPACHRPRGHHERARGSLEGHARARRDRHGGARVGLVRGGRGERGHQSQAHRIPGAILTAGLLAKAGVPCCAPRRRPQDVHLIVTGSASPPRPGCCLLRLPARVQPGVRCHLRDGESLGGLHDEDGCEEGGGQVRHARWHAGQALADLAVEERRVVRLEGQLVHEEDVQDDAEAPRVRLAPVVARRAVKVEHLRCHVMRAAALGAQELARGHERAQAEVSHLDHEVDGLARGARPCRGSRSRRRVLGHLGLGVLGPNFDENVLRLEVAVRHAQRVAEGDGAHDLGEDGLALRLAQALPRVEQREEVAAAHELHDHEYLGGRVVYLEQRDHVGVTEALED